MTREAFLKKLNLDPSKPMLALLPGSRKNELERLAPVMAAAVPAIAAQVPGLQFVVARAPNLNDGLFEPFGLSGVTLRIADVQTDDVLNACDAVVTASGTATVQTALHGKPMVVLYKLSPATYRLGKGLATVDMYAMVNLIAGRRIVVELIQDACTPDAVTSEAVRILTDRPYRDEMIAALAEVRRQLGGPGASDRAADAILELVPRVP
jgi:lipid-A-disaccharide synthase